MFTDKDALKAQRDPLIKEEDEITKKIEGPNRQMKLYKDQKENFGKEIDIYNIATLNAEIKSIQERLGFASLNIGDEKKLIDRKAKLEAQKPKVEVYSAAVAKIKTLHDSHAADFDRLKTLRTQRKVLSDKIKKISEKIMEAKNKKQEVNPKITQLETQKDLIYDEIKKARAKITEVRKEWNDKWYKYEDQQYLIQYIDAAVKKITDLKKELKNKKNGKLNKQPKTKNLLTKMLKVLKKKLKKNFMDMKYGHLIGYNNISKT